MVGVAVKKLIKIVSRRTFGLNCKRVADFKKERDHTHEIIRIELLFFSSGKVFAEKRVFFKCKTYFLW